MQSWKLRTSLMTLAATLCVTFASLSNAQTTWTQCAKENNDCDFQGTMDVRYGANGVFDYGTFTDGVWCGNANFEDLVPRTTKYCYYRSTSTVTDSSSSGSSSSGSSGSGSAAASSGQWTWCVRQGNWCSFKGQTVEVRYGANGQFDYATYTNGAWCGGKWFDDPAPGVTKHCSYRTTTSTSASNSAESSGLAELNVTWTAPTERENGDSLYASEISHYKLQYRPQGSSQAYTSLTVSGASSLSSVLLLEPGNYQVRIAVVDTSGLSSSYSSVAVLNATDVVAVLKQLEEQIAVDQVSSIADGAS